LTDVTLAKLCPSGDEVHDGDPVSNETAATG
jgi:hypothetical protein